MVVIPVEEPSKFCGAFVVGRPSLPVGPFPGERAVVSLDLPVRLWSVGFGELVGRRAECLVERSPAVAGPVEFLTDVKALAV